MVWSSPPPPALLAPSPDLVSVYDSLAIGLQPDPASVASDAASVESHATLATTSTVVTTITTRSTGAADTDTSIGTTPEPLAIDFDSDTTKPDASLTENAPDPGPDVKADHDADDVASVGDAKEAAQTLTRRRSLRIKTVAASFHTPPRNKTVEVATTTESVAETITKHGLRSTDKGNGVLETPSPASATRRVSERLSKLSAATPASQCAKRSLDAMADSKSMDLKSGGNGRKRVKTEDGSGKGSSSGTPEASSSSVGRRVKRKKVWLNHGLYVGQEADFDPTLRPRSAKKASKGSKGKGKKDRSPLLPLPMFTGKQIMETQRDFKMPYHVFAPSPYVRPQTSDWRKLNHNVFIGDAASYWKKEKPSNLKCVCEAEEGCNEHCLNRCTWLECDDANCNIGRELCRNRAFADLRERVKSGTKFAEGVEIMQTEDRGVGLRATRSFEARQIIVEYTGEIITQEESERRMCEDYKKNMNYYLMLFDQNMILDATRGSVARFVNHSCEPNCRMEKWIVEGKPRMALFAGDVGIDAGDELTYDYNFNWFTGVDQQSCKCGSANCRGTLGKRTDVPTVKKPSVMAPPRKKDEKKVKAGKAAAAAAAARKLAALAVIAERANPKPTPSKPSLGMALAAGPKLIPGRGRPRRQENQTLQQRAVIFSPKPKRKAPFPRRAPSLPPLSDRSTSLSPAPTVSTTSVEDSESEDAAPKASENARPERSSSADKRKRSGKPRITRTYKVNKTIAPAVATRSITSQPALDAAKASAIEEAARATERKSRGRPPKSRGTTPKSNQTTPKPAGSANGAKRGRGRPPKERPLEKTTEPLFDQLVNESLDIPVENLIGAPGEKVEEDHEVNTASEGRGGALAALESVGLSTTIANVMNVVGILNPVNVTA